VNTSAMRGAVAVEYLVAFLPLMFFLASVWQIAGLYAAQLIVQRAASAAGRAASVVIPDDPHYYAGEAANSYGAQHRRQVELAADIVLHANPHILAGGREVRVSGFAGNGPLTATVRARFHCFPGWSVFVCGADATRTLVASARYPYHGATYRYP